MSSIIPVVALDALLDKHCQTVTLAEMLQYATTGNYPTSEIFLFRIPLFDGTIGEGVTSETIVSDRYSKAILFSVDAGSPFSRPSAAWRDKIPRFHQHMCVLRELKLQRKEGVVTGLQQGYDTDYDWKSSTASIVDIQTENGTAVSSEGVVEDRLPLWLTYDWRRLTAESARRLVS